MQGPCVGSAERKREKDAGMARTGGLRGLGWGCWEWGWREALEELLQATGGFLSTSGGAGQPFPGFCANNG